MTISSGMAWVKNMLSDNTVSTIGIQDDIAVGSGLMRVFDSIFTALSTPVSGVLVAKYPTAPFESEEENVQFALTKELWGNRMKTGSTEYIHLPPEMCGESLGALFGECPDNHEYVKMMLFGTHLGDPYTYDGSEGLAIICYSKQRVVYNTEVMDFDTGEIIEDKPVEAKKGQDTMTVIGFAPIDLINGPGDRSFSSLASLVDSLGAAVNQATNGWKGNFTFEKTAKLPPTHEQLNAIRKVNGMEPLSKEPVKKVTPAL